MPQSYRQKLVGDMFCPAQDASALGPLESCERALPAWTLSEQGIPLPQVCFCLGTPSSLGVCAGVLSLSTTCQSSAALQLSAAALKSTPMYRHIPGYHLVSHSHCGSPQRRFV